MMVSRSLVPVLFALMVSVVLSASSGMSSVNAVDDLWYPGEGVKQDMYVKYRIQEELTNRNRPYEMTIYFKEQADGNWRAPAFVVDQGRVINGTLNLADNMQALSGGIPSEMLTYVSGYHGSLHYLDAFTTKSEPLSLTASNWGKIASIGGEQVTPRGIENVAFQGAQDVCGADSCDATLIQWRKGVDSKVWVVNEFPFPVKALTYADVTTGQQPIQFAFELLETGMGQPELPSSAEEIPLPPLGPLNTPRGTYKVELDWEPPEIRLDTPVAFGLRLLGSDNLPLERVNYDFTVTDSGGNVVQEFKNQNAELGIATHEVTFTNSGAMSVRVVLNSISGSPAGGGTFTEQVEFGIVVVPEFPIGIAVASAGVLAAVVVATRFRGQLGGLFGARN
jgi:hypothetical protein